MGSLKELFTGSGTPAPCERKRPLHGLGAWLLVPDPVTDILLLAGISG